MILVVNAGSSSIKLALFDGDLTETLSAEASGIGGPGELEVGDNKTEADLPDHHAALSALLDALAAQGITPQTLSAAAHRVVHGGAELVRPTRLTPDAIARIEACAPLAPLHNPHNLSAIRALESLAPDLPQYASFDTAFHATNPDLATRYAVPEDWHAVGIRRYGFHGISYEAMTHTLPAQTGQPLPDRLLACHLGNGASLCAIKDGKSVATTMGYSPLEGLTMGTRSGSIDAGAVLDMAAKGGIDATRETLLRNSGLIGLSGLSSDMRTLESADTPEARFAIDHFCYWATRHAGSMIAAMGGIDAIAFTGGIGENSATVRDKIMSHLAWANLPAAAIHIVPAEEERQIARHAVMCGGGKKP